MFGSAVLDTAIGLLFVFFAVSTVCSNIYTIISRMLNTRGKLLQSTLERVLGPEYYKEILQNPIIGASQLKNLNLFGFKIDVEREPDWIDPKQFSRVMGDLCVKMSDVTDYTRVVSGDLTETVEHFIDQVRRGARTYDELLADIESWYNNTMYQLTDLFKQHSQLFIATIATVIVLVFNINAIVITDALWRGPTLRSAVVEAANAQVSVINEQGGVVVEDDATITATIEQEIGDLAALDIPIGWTADELDNFGLPTDLAMRDNPATDDPSAFNMLVGWIITIGAAMFGAPFWFDLLKKVISLRRD